MFPSDEELATLKVFPGIESRTLEFKQTIDVPFTKLLPTICAFLNAGSGAILFGVKDNQDIVGIRTNEKRFDTFLLLIDNILHSNLIAETTGAPLKPDSIVTRCVPCWNGASILIVDMNGSGGTYQLKDGSMYHRLNASNMRISGCALYNESDVLLRIESVKRGVQDQYHGIFKKVEQQLMDHQARVRALEKDTSETLALLHNKILREKDTADSVRNPGFLTYITCGLF